MSGKPSVRYVNVEPGTVWPLTDSTDSSLEWMLRYFLAISPDAALAAASIIRAYEELIRLPRRRRDAVVRVLRKAKGE